MPLLTAFYDACVLYPAPLRDLLVNLAIVGPFQAKWTLQVQEEWVRSLLENRPDLKRERLERTCALMNRSVRDCLVTGYESLIPALTLPDPDDRHILAAAIVVRADVIVTFNLNDFPASALHPHGVMAQHPDDFIRSQLDSAPEAVLLAVREQRVGLINPPKTVEDLLDTLEKQGLRETAAYLRRFSPLL